jgi:hypothetical protein
MLEMELEEITIEATSITMGDVLERASRLFLSSQPEGTTKLFHQSAQAR